MRTAVPDVLTDSRRRLPSSDRPRCHAAVSRWLGERWPFEREIYADRPTA